MILCDIEQDRRAIPCPVATNPRDRPSRPLDAPLLGELVHLGGPVGTVGVVGAGDALVALHLLECGTEDPPSLTELVIAAKEGLLAVEGIEDQSLVRVGHVLRRVGPLGAVAEVKLCPRQLVGEAGDLVDNRQVDGLVGLQPDHKLVGPLTVEVLAAEQPPRNLLEADAHLGQALVEGLASAHEEGHPVPPPVVDGKGARRKRGRARPLGYLLVVVVARLGAGGGVLAQAKVAGGEGLDAPEELDLLVPHVVGVHAGGCLHREEGEHLHQVVLHDVPHDSRVVKVAGAALDPKGLLEVNLHRVNVPRVPEGLKDKVAEAHCHNVLHELLAEVVVDAVDLLLRQLLGQVDRQLLVARRVPPEGLLDDDPRVSCRRLAAPCDAARRVGKDGGRDGEVVEAVHARRLVPVLKVGHGLAAHLAHGLLVVITPRKVGHPPHELIHELSAPLSLDAVERFRVDPARKHLHE
mmetsp:Transcript_30693/g.71722  ORF Transcript_30693/g.71722 Transcript_30693/m.71722 type:complete len:465 (-) Transcript_30693:211-1605(-)